jgi:hypothetical protein
MCLSSATDVSVIEARDNILKLVKTHSLGWRPVGMHLNGERLSQSLFWASRSHQALETTRMKRHISVVLHDACEEALQSMIGNAEYEHVHFDRPPSSWANWVMWWRGFVAGVIGDRNNIPLIDRLVMGLKVSRALVARLFRQTWRTWGTLIRRSETKTLSAGPFSGSWPENASLLVVRVDEAGKRSVLSIGSTGYGKGHRPVDGHRPALIIESSASESATSQDRLGDDL